MNFDKAAVLGATGPAGLHITRELQQRGVAVRVVSRDAAKLERMFPAGAERVAADLLKADDAKRALDGCSVAFHCIGLPAAAMEQHSAAARNVADGLAASGARCVHVSSYWAFLPVVGTPMNEDHPRQGGTPWMRHRRAAEDKLREAGAAIANLPDFYGPHVHTSTLQQPLKEAAQGRTTMRWIGRADTDREYAFIPDAAATIVSLAGSDDAYGEHWLIPTAGPLNGRRVAEIVSEVLVPKVRVRGTGLAALRLASLFDADLRAFMQMVPQYVKPISYETIKIEGLLGPQPVTPYEEGIRRTLEWLRRPAVEEAAGAPTA
ncbi:MAG: NAD(P)H-binding protein [Gammaproteobacteria bacterium]|nr:NAD(P)H-binding protein [Gammaproteobacteria bacterium]